MKLSLQEICDKIDKEIGKLSPVTSTEQVIRNKFHLAKANGLFKTKQDPQKRRSYEAWRDLLLISRVLVEKKAS